MYEDNQEFVPLEEEEQPPEESGNRTFLIAAAVLGGLVLLSIACIAIYGLVILPRQAAARQNQQATLVAQELLVSQGLTGTAAADMLTLQAMATPTLPPTSTPVVQLPTPTVATPDPATATVAAALTQAAQAQLTATVVPTSTLLPQTGFMDQTGAPGLMVMAIALIVVIVLARRLRTIPR